MHLKAITFTFQWYIVEDYTIDSFDRNIKNVLVFIDTVCSLCLTKENIFAIRRVITI